LFDFFIPTFLKRMLFTRTVLFFPDEAAPHFLAKSGQVLDNDFLASQRAIEDDRVDRSQMNECDAF
jgi:hypothetical protein